MSLLATSLCRTCAKLDVARQSRHFPNAVFAQCLQRSVSYTSHRQASWGYKVAQRRKRSKGQTGENASQADVAAADVSIEDQIRAALSSESPPPPAKKQPKAKAAAPVEVSLEDQFRAAFSSPSPEEPVAKKQPNKQSNKQPSKQSNKQPNKQPKTKAAPVEVSIEDQIRAALSPPSQEKDSQQPAAKKQTQPAAKTKPKASKAAPLQELSIEDQIRGASAPPTPKKQPKADPTPKKQPKADASQQPSAGDQITAALSGTADAPAPAPEPAPAPAPEPKPKKKPAKLRVKGVARNETGDIIPVSKDLAASLAGVTLPVKKYHRKPTYTDGIGMLNQGVATTSQRKTPRFASPTETPPRDYDRQKFYLAPTGSFTYDVDVMPFDWRDARNYTSPEPKRLPWVPVEDVPAPGVVVPRWWPKTQEGWDQLDAPQLHAAEEAYARFNPKQPTDSQAYHRAKKAAVQAMGRHKRELQRQAADYEAQLRVLDGKKKPRLPPSAASGGVPSPSHEYLVAVDAAPSQRLEQPQPLLVVVDLNGTMLHRPSPKRQPRRFVQRPHAAVFLNYCIKTFWVVVWSSARADNVAVMCDNLATPEVVKRDVVAVWARDRFGLSDADFNTHVQCYKRLTKLWQDPDVARSHPAYASGGRWSQANTVLIDDTPDKARAEPFNAIIVPEFADDNGKYDGILPVVHDYLNELCFQSNVSNYMRHNPFHARADYEAAADTTATSMAFYNEKSAVKKRTKARKDYTYGVSSLNLKNTLARADADDKQTRQ